MHKKFIIAGLSLATALAIGHTAFAEERMGTSTGTRGDRMEMKEEMEQKREEMKRKGEEMREEMKEKRAEIKERRKEIVKKQIERVIKRMGSHIERLGKIAERIDSRIEKFEEQGRDMTEASDKLEIAKTEISDAAAALEVMKTALENIISSTGTTTNETLVRSIKSASSEVTQAIKSAHRALVDTINSLKPGRNEKATSTPNTDDSDL